MAANVASVGRNGSRREDTRTAPALRRPSARNDDTAQGTLDLQGYGRSQSVQDQLNVYIEPQTTITALVDHFQLLQLLRLSNDITAFVDMLAADEKFLSKGAVSIAPTVNLLLPIAQVWEVDEGDGEREET